MPVGSLKNTLYGLALPVLGKSCEWPGSVSDPLEKVLRKHHVVGTAIQRFEKGGMTDFYTVGYASLEKKRPVEQETIFRTASVAKMVTALLVFRLQTKGLLNTNEDISELLGYPVRNPAHPDKRITLGMVLSHTSSIVDSAEYFASFANPTPLRTLLQAENAFLTSEPGTVFRYSNLAAGMVGCMLENRFEMSIESLAQRELFQPLRVTATFDMSSLDPALTADSWRVLPPALAFDAHSRIAAAKSMGEPDPEKHYLLASGSLFLTAQALAKLALTAWNGAGGFLNEESLAQMQTPILGWPDQTVKMQHGMGLLKMDDQAVLNRPLWGHQGFAYGAVNGVFFDAQGNGFVCLNSGASEQRTGHLACLNRDLIALLMKENPA